MEAIYRRTAYTARYAARKAARRQAKADRLERDHQRAIQRAHDNHWDRFAKAARRHRVEDWRRGPLAPRRDVGRAAETYGALSMYDGQRGEVAEPRDRGLRVGDRVCVARRGHRDEGRIGRLLELDEKRETATVEGLNVGDMWVPEPFRALDQNHSAVRPTPLPFNLADLRLVAALPVPGTRGVRDVVINELSLAQRGGALRRAVAGVAPPLEIPFPEAEKEPNYDEADCDTYRIEVEARTFAPSLRAPPMPPALVDELRGRYSKFRTRHDDEYIRKKDEAARMAEVRRLASARRMVTPLQELRQKRRADRRARGWPGLDSDALDHIGATMARSLRLSGPKSPLLSASSGSGKRGLVAAKAT